MTLSDMTATLLCIVSLSLLVRTLTNQNNKS